jgi:hypothetical protein
MIRQKSKVRFEVGGIDRFIVAAPKNWEAIHAIHASAAVAMRQIVVSKSGLPGKE